MELFFNIVVPVYNSELWIEKCLKSISIQSYNKWRCVVINDASTDNTQNIIDNLEFVNKDKRFTIIHNKSNKKALSNIVNGFNILESKNHPDSILTVIDGDDFLYDEDSLKKVFLHYHCNKDLLLTYGNWIGYPDMTRSNCFKYSDQIIQKSLFRNSDFVASHLRTFKSKLWYSINFNDLKDSRGDFFSVGWDVAFMIPMLEMAQERHVFIEDILYVYNKQNPISDYKIRLQEQNRIVNIVKQKLPYERKSFV